MSTVPYGTTTQVLDYELTHSVSGDGIVDRLLLSCVFYGNLWQLSVLLV